MNGIACWGEVDASNIYNFLQRPTPPKINRWYLLKSAKKKLAEQLIS